MWAFQWHCELRQGIHHREEMSNSQLRPICWASESVSCRLSVRSSTNQSSASGRSTEPQACSDGLASFLAAHLGQQQQHVREHSKAVDLTKC